MSSKLLVLVLSLFFFQSVGLSQLSRLEILEDKLKSAENIHQEIDINLGISLYYLYHYFDLDKALSYAETVIKLSKANKIEKFEAIGLAFKGRIQNHMGVDNFGSAIQEAVNLSNQIKDPQAVSTCTSILAEFFWHTEDNLVEKLGRIIDEYNKDLGDIEKGILFFEKGFSNYESGDLDASMSDYNQAIHLIENAKPYYRQEIEGVSSIEMEQGNRSLISSYLQKAILYLELNMESKAIQTVENTFAKAKNKEETARCYQDLAYIQMNFGRFKDVSTNLSKASEIYKELGNSIDYCTSIRDLAQFNILTKQYDKAANLLMESSEEFLVPEVKLSLLFLKIAYVRKVV